MPDQREPGAVSEQAQGDLRLQPPLLGEPALPEPVALVSLEVRLLTSYRTRPAGPSPAHAAHASDSLCRQKSLLING